MLNSYKKQCHYVEDTLGVSAELYYLRTKEGREIDFVIVMEHRLVLLIEVKTSDDQPSRSFAHFRKFLGPVEAVQLVWHLKRDFDTPDGVQIRRLLPWLAALRLEHYGA